MIHSKENSILKAKEQFQELLERVQRTLSEGERVDTVERDLFRQLLDLGHSMLSIFIVNQGTGDVGETVTVNGETWRRLAEPHERRYVSVFGEIRINRHVYGTREGQKIQAVPLDGQLGLPASDFSYVYQDWVQRLCVKESFADSNETLRELLGVSTGVRTLEHMNQALAEHASAFQEEHKLPPAAEEGELVVFTADAKGVPMRRTLEERMRGQRRGKGEKANQKQMAYVGGVYTIEPFVRTPEDVIGEIDRKAYAAARPEPCHKRIWTEMTEEPASGPETDKDQRATTPIGACPDGADSDATTDLKNSGNGRDRLFGRLAEEVRQRARKGTKRIVCLFDGESALWKLYLTCFAVLGAVGVLDIIHVIERLWKAAHCFHKEGSGEAREFVQKYLRMLLEGKVGYVVGAFRQMITKGDLTASRKKLLREVITYFENHRDWMKYDEYLAAGYPIGTGVVEGACRYVVKDRMERSGMRWSLPGAQALLDLRAIHANGQWREYVEYRIGKEQEALYAQAA